MTNTERGTTVGFNLVFFTIAAVVALFNRLPPIPDAVFIVLLGLAAYRGGRAISYDYVFKWVRDLCGVVDEDDTSGAGQSANPGGKGMLRVFGEWACCPICTGTWVGMALLALETFLPPFGTVLIYALAAAGLAEFLHNLTESAAWKARLAREEAGSLWLYKNRPEFLRELDERRGGQR